MTTKTDAMRGFIFEINDDSNSSDWGNKEFVEPLTKMLETIEERRATPHEEEVEEVNLGDQIDPKITQILKSLLPEEKATLVELLKEYRDCFA